MFSLLQDATCRCISCVRHWLLVVRAFVPTPLWSSSSDRRYHFRASARSLHDNGPCAAFDNTGHHHGVNLTNPWHSGFLQHFQAWSALHRCPQYAEQMSRQSGVPMPSYTKLCVRHRYAVRRLGWGRILFEPELNSCLRMS